MTKKIINFIMNNQTNLLGSMYVILVQGVACIFHVAKFWTKKDWPVKCLIAIDKPAKFLKMAFEKKSQNTLPTK